MLHVKRMHYAPIQREEGGFPPQNGRMYVPKRGLGRLPFSHMLVVGPAFAALAPAAISRTTARAQIGSPSPRSSRDRATAAT